MRDSTEVRQINITRRQSPRDTRQQLWGVILEASSKQIGDNIAAAAVVASGGIERLQRLWTPPPQGMYTEFRCVSDVLSSMSFVAHNSIH